MPHLQCADSYERALALETLRTRLEVNLPNFKKNAQLLAELSVGLEDDVHTARDSWCRSISSVRAEGIPAAV